MSETAPPCVGIDLGTTHSLVAYLRHGRTTLIPNSAGKLLTPSAVACLADGRIVVGETAQAYRAVRPEQCAVGFKRHMGTTHRTVLGAREWSPVELSSLVLRTLRGDAERHLGVAICDAVITVPAYFNEAQRLATRAAADLAGLHVQRLINEPTAAALAHGFRDKGKDGHVIVLDLGGGTFDVTVLKMFHGISEVVATAGESFLGGDDITEALCAHVRGELGESHGLLDAMLHDDCERAKRVLSEESVVTLEVGTLQITRDTLTHVSQPFIDRMATVIARATHDSRVPNHAFDAILMAGGATRMPQVRALAEEVFGQPPTTKISPDFVVAIGAAIQAAILRDDEAVEDIVFTDVCPWSLGVEVMKDLGKHKRPGYFIPLIHRNTTIPCSREEVLQTVEDEQTSVEIHVFQGESRYVKDNLMIGSVNVRGLPRAAAGLPVTVRFTYDVSGLLEVEAFAEGTEPVREVIMHRPAELTEEALAEAKERLASVRFFPRDEEDNLRLLTLGAAAIARIRPTLRGDLEALVDDYEKALHGDDPVVFGEARGRLHAKLVGLGLLPGGATSVH